MSDELKRWYVEDPDGDVTFYASAAEAKKAADTIMEEEADRADWNAGWQCHRKGHETMKSMWCWCYKLPFEWADRYIVVRAYRAHTQKPNQTLIDMEEYQQEVLATAATAYRERDEARAECKQLRDALADLRKRVEALEEEAKNMRHHVHDVHKIQERTTPPRTP